MNDVDDMPVMTEVWEVVAWFLARGEPTAEELFSACMGVGRIPAVALLADLHREGLLSPVAATAIVGDIWSMSEYPDRHLDHETWRELFALAGYTVDGARAARPASTVRLWRGSVPERRGDWSWTDSREVAARYASGEWYHRPTGRVWVADVEPWRLLARNTERGESEYVVDTEGLDIRPDDDLD